MHPRKTPLEPCPIALPFDRRRKKTDRGQISGSPSETSRFEPLILAHRGSALPCLVGNRAASSLAESSTYSPDRAQLRLTGLAALHLACHHLPKKGTLSNLSSEEEHLLVNTIHIQPYRRLVSTDRLNREDIQLAASLEGESGPIPTGTTLPRSHPKPRFRRERAQGVYARVSYI